MNDSTRKSQTRKADRPKKPYADFPLTPHSSGKWQKKIRGSTHYFGRWAKTVNGKLERIPGDGWEEALKLYRAQADDLHAGRTPRAKEGALIIMDLCNRFLTAKKRKLDAGEIGSRSYADYREVTDTLMSQFDKNRLVENLAADDFEKLRADLAERWGPVRLGNVITRIKSVFKFAFDNDLLKTPIRYGSEFKKPAKAVLRRHRAQHGQRILDAADLRTLMDAADTQMRAMILLGLNCGFGNHDVASLPRSAIDLEKGWVDFPRPKTGIPRRCWLWPETVAAIRNVMASRPTPSDPADAEIVFLQSTGRRLVRDTKKSRRDDLWLAFAAVLKKVKLHRPGTGFYTLRRIFRTIADGARDQVAFDLIMGHSDPTMAGHYRERIDDARLETVATVVRDWLFKVK